MRVYTEDQITFPGAEIKQLSEVPGWQSFQDDTKHIVPQSYLYNARKFAHKVYAQLDAFESEHRYVVWFDADIVFKQKITKPFLKRLVEDHLCAYLGRKGCYTETGFIVFDTEHEDFQEFKQRYRAYYDERMLFALNYWIDCTAFDAARYGLQARNLTPDVEGMVDVFSRSPLAEYAEHDKGMRKYKRAG